MSPLFAEHVCRALDAADIRLKIRCSSGKPSINGQEMCFLAFPNYKMDRLRANCYLSTLSSPLSASHPFVAPLLSTQKLLSAQFFWRGIVDQWQSTETAQTWCPLQWCRCLSGSAASGRASQPASPWGKVGLDFPRSRTWGFHLSQRAGVQLPFSSAHQPCWLSRTSPG